MSASPYQNDKTRTEDPAKVAQENLNDAARSLDKIQRDKMDVGTGKKKV